MESINNQVETESTYHLYSDIPQTSSSQDQGKVLQKMMHLPKPGRLEVHGSALEIE